MNSRHIQAIEKLLDDVSRQAAAPDEQLQRTHGSVSAWSVSQQLDHAIKVANALMRGILEPADDRPRRGINLVGRVILLLGDFPRGRAQSPKGLRGVAASSQDLVDELNVARSLLKRVADESFQPPDVPVVRHPFFGGLTPQQSLRNTVVHTRHHLRIVRDINAAWRSRG